MPNRKISELTLATSSLATDGLVIQRGGTNYRLEAANFSTDTADTGSLVTTSSITGTTITFTKGDGSTYTNEIVSASYAVTASHEVVKEVSSSYAETATSASHALRADETDQAISASYAVSASLAQLALETISSSYAISASHAEISDEAISSSYAITASHATSTAGTLSNGTLVDAFSFDGSTDVTVDISTYSASVSTDRTALSASTSTAREFYIITGSISGLTQSFTKGNGSTFDINLPDTGSPTLSSQITGGLGINPFIFNGTADADVRVDVTSSHFTVGVSASQAPIITALSASLTTTDQTISSSVAALSGSASDARNLIAGDLDTLSASFNERINDNDDDIAGLNTYTASLKDAISVSGPDVTILGDLTVQGTQSIIHSTEVSIDDNILSLNGTGATNGGIEVNDPSGPLSGSLLWDGGNNRWIAGQSGSESVLLVADGLGILSSSAQIAGDISGSSVLPISTLSGSASDARNLLAADLDAISSSASTAREDYFNAVSVATDTNTITLTRGDGTDVVSNLISSSYAVTASHAITASYAVSASFAQTASSVLHLEQDVFISGTLFQSGSVEMNRFEINNLGGPYETKDAATKEYIDRKKLDTIYDIFDLDLNSAYSETIPTTQAFMVETIVSASMPIVATHGNASTRLIVREFNTGSEDFTIIDTGDVTSQFPRASGVFVSASHHYFTTVNNAGVVYLQKFDGSSLTLEQTSSAYGACNEKMSHVTAQDANNENNAIICYASSNYNIVRYVSGSYEAAVSTTIPVTPGGNLTNTTNAVHFNGDYYITIWNETNDRREIWKYDFEAETATNVVTLPSMTGGGRHGGVFMPSGEKLYEAHGTQASTMEIYEIDVVNNSYRQVGTSSYTVYGIYADTLGEIDNENQGNYFIAATTTTNEMQYLKFNPSTLEVKELGIKAAGTWLQTPRFIEANSQLYPIVGAYSSNRYDVHKLEADYQTGDLLIANNGNWKTSSELTTAISLPVGNTTERPNTAESGSLRFNSETNYLEYKDTGSWKSAATKNYVDTLSGSASDARNVLATDYIAADTTLSASLTTTDQTISASVAALSGSASTARNTLAAGLAPPISVVGAAWDSSTAAQTMNQGKWSFNLNSSRQVEESDATQATFNTTNNEWILKEGTWEISADLTKTASAIAQTGFFHIRFNTTAGSFYNAGTAIDDSDVTFATTGNQKVIMRAILTVPASATRYVWANFGSGNAFSAKHQKMTVKRIG